jgi:hypothetical protein
MSNLGQDLGVDLGLKIVRIVLGLDLGIDLDLKIARIVRGPDQGPRNAIAPNPDQEIVKDPRLIAPDLKVVTTDLDLKIGIIQDLKVVVDPSQKTDLGALDPSLKTDATTALDLVPSPKTEKMIVQDPKVDLDLSLDPNPTKIVRDLNPMKIVSLVDQSQNLDQNRQVPTKVQK